MKNRQDPIFENDTLDDGDYFEGEDGYVHEANGDIAQCWGVAFQGRAYLSNGDPGYPTEYCDEEATQLIEGEPYCAHHAREQDYLLYGDDPDEARDRMLDQRWEWENDPTYRDEY